MAEMSVRRLAAQGVDIKYCHRADRKGFKAGALEAGLKVARGELIAIFDADFIPPRISSNACCRTFRILVSAWSRRVGATSTAITPC